MANNGYFGSLFSKKKGKKKVKSVFVMTGQLEGDYRSKLYEVKLDEGGLVIGGFDTTPRSLLGAPVARFFKLDAADNPLIVCLDGVCIGSQLYLLLNLYCEHNNDDTTPTPTTTKPCDTLIGYIYDLKTRGGGLVEFSIPKANKPYPIVIYANKKIYCLLDPSFCPYEMAHCFERYDPIMDSWESLEPFPYSEDEEVDWSKTRIIGHAVYGEFLLFCSFHFSYQQYKVMSYHENTGWELVSNEEGKKVGWSWEPVSNEECDKIGWSGAATVIVGEEGLASIYAFSLTEGRVVTFSVRNKVVGPKICLSLSKLSVLDLDVEIPLGLSTKTHILTHLGDMDFCLVQTGHDYTGDRNQQTLYINTFRVERENKVIVLDSTSLDVIHESCCEFFIEFCFPVVWENIEQNGDDKGEETTTGNCVGGGINTGGLLRRVKEKAKFITLFGFLIPATLHVGMKFYRLSRLPR